MLMPRDAETFIDRVTNSLVLPCHLTIITEFVFLVNGHYVRLCCDHNHVIAIFILMVHGTVVESERIFLVINIVSAIGVHEDAKALYADTAEDTEDLTLVIIEFRRRFTAEGEKVVAEESLDAGKREMCQAGAVVKQRVYALFMSVKVLFCYMQRTYRQGEIGAIAKMHSLEHARCDGSTRSNLLRLG